VFRGYLNFYATPNWRMSQAFAAAHADAVEYGGPVPKAQISAAYEGFDVLLLVLGPGRYVTSGKVFEYMATGLPIVSVHSPENVVRDIVTGYPLWFPAAALDADSIADALRAAAAVTVDRDRFVRLRTEGIAYARQFERRRQLAPAIAALDRHRRSSVQA
jgi:glycosyltransferase involved in cell wall biosynthesis